MPWVSADEFAAQSCHSTGPPLPKVTRSKTLADLKTQADEENLRDLAVPRWTEHRNVATMLRDEWEQRVRFDLSQFGITHEAQLLTGSAIKTDVLRGKDEDINYQASLSVKQDIAAVTPKIMLKDPSDMYSDKIYLEEERLARASAAYMVTYWHWPSTVPPLAPLGLRLPTDPLSPLSPLSPLPPEDNAAAAPPPSIAVVSPPPSSAVTKDEVSGSKGGGDGAGAVAVASVPAGESGSDNRLRDFEDGTIKPVPRGSPSLSFPWVFFAGELGELKRRAHSAARRQTRFDTDSSGTESGSLQSFSDDQNDKVIEEDVEKPQQLDDYAYAVEIEEC